MSRPGASSPATGAPEAPPADPSLVDAGEVLGSLGVDPASGLSSAEAAQRLARAGPNRLDPAAQVPAWRKLLAQFDDPLIYLLLVAIAISVAAWALEGAQGVPFEAIVIAVIVVANAVLGFVQERKAEQAVAALQRMAAPAATVVRDGAQSRVPAEELVPGDVMVLAEGDAVGADGRLVQVASLQVAESSLTGESEPVLKDRATLPAPAPLGDRTNLVFSGTAVTRGRGRAVVTATGMATEMGRIAALLGRTEEDRTPLQREVDLVGRTLGIAVIAIAVVVVAAILLTSDIQRASDLVQVLLLGVSLAVAAVPEGLPAVLSVVLALGVQRMARQHAIVKKLSSVETLGSASVICSDKTGTLTKNEMTIQRVVTRSGEVAVTGIGYRPEGEFRVGDRPLDDGPLLDEVQVVLAGGSLANDALLEEQDGQWTVQGDPTDAAFLVAERKLGITEARRARFTRLDEVPFTSERKLMSSIEADSARAGQISVVTKGAPDVLLARCTRERAGDAVRELTGARRAEILAGVDRLAEAALRTLAVAYDPMKTTEAPAADESVEQGLVFAGVVGIIDPPRPEAAAAIGEAHAAGLRVIMITGDHPRTAARIATDLGIAAPGAGQATAAALTGMEVDALDEEAFAERVRTVSVYARVAPEHKLRIVDALQDDGNIVAMTGDGVNDAPALKSADIGIAMGVTGTDVTKEAAKMILADDNFATIVAAVREGRAIFANIRKFLRYLLSSNTGEVLTMFLGVVGASVLGLDTAGGAVVAPLLATQILWINLLTDTAPALAMGVDPPPRDVMRYPPRKLTDRVIDREMQVGVLLVGLVMALATLFVLDLKLPGGLVEGSAGLTEARTAAFTVLVLAQLFNCFNSRSDRVSAFRGLFTNHWLWAAIALSLVLQILVVHVPILNRAFGTTPLSAGDWLLCAALASSVLWADELKKLLGRRVASNGRSAALPSTPSPSSEQPASAVEASAPASSRLPGADRLPRLPRGLLVLLTAASAVVTVGGLRAASGIIGPAFLALVLVISVHPLLAWLQRHRVPSWLAVVLTMVCAYALILALAGALVFSAARLATLLPTYEPQFASLVDQASEWLGDLGVTQEQLNSVISQFDLGSLVGVLQQVLSGATSVVSDLTFILVLLFFLIIDSSSFPRRLAAAEGQRPQLVGALTSFAGATRQYVVVSTVFGLIVALIDVAALYWLDVPLPWLWGLLAFITNYIPNIGFVLGLVPPALLALLQGGIRQALLVVVAYSVINFVIQSLFQPKFVGDAVGLSITLTFLSLVFWSYVMGPLGALLAVPLSLFVKALLVDADPASRWLAPLIDPGSEDRSEEKG